ncbi:MAG: OsmC family protein [Bryobacteraceae bacterium]
MGTFGGALEARQIPASAGRLECEAVGEVETEDRVLVLKRVHVRLKLKAEAAHRETVERVHGVFHDRCPVYRSLKAAIAMTTELAFEEIAAP